MLSCFKTLIAISLLPICAQATDEALPPTPEFRVVGPTADAQEKAEDAGRSAIEKAKRDRMPAVTLPSAHKDKEKLRLLAEQARRRGIERMKEMSAQHQDSADAPMPGGAGAARRQASAGPTTPSNNSTTSTRPVTGLLLVALSSSMPEQTLREYMAQLDGVKGAVVALRGFVGGATQMKPTGRWVELMRRKDAARMERGHYNVDVKVDPLIYRNLGITQVPAVAYLDGVIELKHCDEDKVANVPVIYGATTVSSALREIRKAGGTVPEDLIREMEGV